MDKLTQPTQIKDLLSEKDKEDKDYLIGITDLTISQLVKDKDEVRKAYNYYNGVRDKDQFRHLEEVYGLGMPTSIEFIPLVRPHIDQLIGELLQIPFKPQVTCKDKKTLNLINRDKQLKIAEELYNETKNQVNNSFINQILQAEGQQQGAVEDPLITKKLEEIKENLTKNFISEYEEQVQYLLEYFKQSKSVDLLAKRKELFKALMIAGECYFNISTDKRSAIPEFEVLHPMHTFIEDNPNSIYFSKARRGVIRRKMNRQDVLLRYGHLLKKEDLEKIENKITGREDGNMYYMTSNDEGIIAGVSPTVMGGSPAYPDNWYNWFYRDLLDVYEVQFLSANKYTVGDEVRYRIDRYETIRIGEDIYILKGKSDDVFRDPEDPDNQTLTMGGIRYSDINGKPYSLMLQTANLQDKYDLLHFHRDTIIQLSGVKGLAIDSSVIPTWLGETPEERLQKTLAYIKTGFVAIDTAQEGATQNNTAIFQDFDLGLDGNSLQAIQLAITATEEACSRITGVFRERLGQIEQRDAVSNVQTGIHQSAIITKQYFQTIDLITKEILENLINTCRLTFKNDTFVGSIVLGNGLNKIFEVKPELLSFTSYDIHIDDSGDIVRDMQKIEQLSLELIKGGQMDADVVISAVGTHSMTQMKHNLLEAYEKKRKENSQLQQMEQQLLEQQKNAQQLQQQMNKLTQENENLKAKDRELEKYKVDKEFELGMQQNNTTAKYNVEKIALDKRRVELEQLQLLDNNPNNNEIRNA